MSRNRTFPKENEKKLKELIRDLKSQIQKLEKENRFLLSELENIVKPVRKRKPHVERERLEYDVWRKDFLERFKKEVLGEKK